MNIRENLNKIDANRLPDVIVALKAFEQSNSFTAMMAKRSGHPSRRNGEQEKHDGNSRAGEPGHEHPRQEGRAGHPCNSDRAEDG